MAYFQMSDADDKSSCWYHVSRDNKAFSYLDASIIDILNDPVLQLAGSKLHFSTADCTKLVPAQYLQLPTQSDVSPNLIDKLQIECNLFRNEDKTIEYAVNKQNGMPLDVYIDNEKAVEFTSAVHVDSNGVESSLVKEMLFTNSQVPICEGSESANVLSKKENAAINFILIAKMESLYTKFYQKTKWIELMGKKKK